MDFHFQYKYGHLGSLVRTVNTLARRISVAQTTTSSSDYTVRFPTEDTALTQGTTGLSYNDSTGVFTNNSGRTLCLLITYCVTFVANTTCARTSYIRLNGSQRYGQLNVPASPDVPALNGAAMIILKSEFGKIVSLL